MLEQAGRDEEAITFYQRAAEAYQREAEAGDTDALKEAAAILNRAGRPDEAARLLRYGIEPGGRIADPWEASIQA